MDYVQPTVRDMVRVVAKRMEAQSAFVPIADFMHLCKKAFPSPNSKLLSLLNP